MNKYIGCKMIRKKGYTLIEIVVVMGIIAILSTLLIGAIQIARRSSKNAQRLTDAKTFQVAVETYYAKNKVYPSAGGWHGPYWCPEVGVSCAGVTTNLITGGFLSESFPGTTDNPKRGILYCTPSTNNGTYKLWVTVDPAADPTYPGYPDAECDNSATPTSGIVDLSKN